MSLGSVQQVSARRFAPGRFLSVTLCLCATAALILLALQRGGLQAVAVEYYLPPKQVLAGTLPPTSARENLELFSITGDTRFLRYAHAKLNASNPNTQNSLLRARIQQAEHHFDAAAETLMSVVQSQPANTEAWLLLADSLIRAGRIDDARKACFKLALTANAGLAEWCAILTLQASGDDQLAYSRAQALLAASVTQQDSVRRWTLEIAADSAARLGLAQDAIDLYRRVLAIGGESFASRLALADALIAAGQNAAAEALLDADRDKVAALIRLAIARKASDSAVDGETLDRITTSFAGMSPATTNDLRLRDRALFELRVRENFVLALEYAEANWRQQKGPEDRALLRETAEAAGRQS